MHPATATAKNRTRTKKPEFKNAPGHCLLAASGGILLSAFRLAVKHPALCRVHGNGAQQVLMGFLVSSAADVQLIDHIVLRAVLHIAQLEQIRTQRVVLPVIGKDLLYGGAPAALHRASCTLPLLRRLVSV